LSLRRHPGEDGSTEPGEGFRVELAEVLGSGSRGDSRRGSVEYPTESPTRIAPARFRRLDRSLIHDGEKGQADFFPP
jgi:hypothetical protein